MHFVVDVCWYPAFGVFKVKPPGKPSIDVMGYLGTYLRL